MSEDGAFGEREGPTAAQAQLLDDRVAMHRLAGDDGKEQHVDLTGEQWFLLHIVTKANDTSGRFVRLCVATPSTRSTS